MYRLHLSADGAVLVADARGLYVGWTEHSPALGWSASWRDAAGEHRKFSPSPAAAGDVLRAAFREELS